MGTWTTAIRTWAAGETVTAANLNAQLKDFAGGFGAWTSYTPAWTQSTTITKTTNYAKYARIQKTVFCQVQLIATGGGTGGNAISVALPVTAAYSAALCIGSGSFYDASPSGHYAGAAILLSATTVGIYTSASTTAAVGSTPSLTVATGDQIFLSLMYEAA